MKNRLLQGAIVTALLMWHTFSFSEPMRSETGFKNEVSPILHDYCLNCHQPGGKGYEKSGLDMSSYQSLMKGTKFGSVINPGNALTSILIQVVEGRVHASIKMPYGMNGGLAKDKIETLRKWVSQGAKDN